MVLGRSRAPALAPRSPDSGFSPELRNKSAAAADGDVCSGYWWFSSGGMISTSWKSRTRSDQSRTAGLLQWRSAASICAGSIPVS